MSKKQPAKNIHSCCNSDLPVAIELPVAPFLLDSRPPEIEGLLQALLSPHHLEQELAGHRQPFCHWRKKEYNKCSKGLMTWS